MMRAWVPALVLLAACPSRDRGASRPSAAANGLTVAIYTGLEEPKAPDPAAAAATAPAPMELRVAPPPPPPGTPPQPPRKRVSVALVDDRREVEVDADGVLRLPDVADGIALASLIVEPLDGRRFVVETCARPRAASDQRATLVTVDGITVTGRLSNPSGDGRTWIVEDDQGHTHVVRGEVERVSLPGAGAREVRCDTPRPASTACASRT
jgi:hypothetical protein